MIVEKCESRDGYTIVYFILKTTSLFGERNYKGSDKIVNEDGRWGLVLSDKFMKKAKEY